jgi:lipoprotein NlpI
MADLDQLRAIDPKNAYAALWLEIVSKRNKQPGRLAEATRQIEMTKWPAPIIRTYLGQTTAEAAIAAADDPNPVTKKGNVCDANFYLGQLALQRGAKDEAGRLFRLAAAGCPKTYLVWPAANAELKALGAAS